jgi:hypothetical protein
MSSSDSPKRAFLGLHKLWLPGSRNALYSAMERIKLASISQLRDTLDQLSEDESDDDDDDADTSVVHNTAINLSLPSSSSAQTIEHVDSVGDLMQQTSEAKRFIVRVIHRPLVC